MTDCGTGQGDFKARARWHFIAEARFNWSTPAAGSLAAVPPLFFYSRAYSFT